MLVLINTLIFTHKAYRNSRKFVYTMSVIIIIIIIIIVIIIIIIIIL